jgi:uncharacterized protein YndB with AHSA1/START domain
MANDTVTVTRRYAAAADRVFDAWLDPASARQWLFATPAGQMQRVDIDARVGGRFTVIERRDGSDAEHRGAYVELDRPRRLAFDFSVPQFSSRTTRVTLALVPQGKGCELTLVHTGVLPDYVERSAEGWKTMLDGLARTLGETGPPPAP